MNLKNALLVLIIALAGCRKVDDTSVDPDTDADTDTDTDTDSDTDTDADVTPPGDFVSLTSGGGSADAGGMHLKVAIDGQSYSSADGGGYHMVLGPIVSVP